MSLSGRPAAWTSPTPKTWPTRTSTKHSAIASALDRHLRHAGAPGAGDVLQQPNRFGLLVLEEAGPLLNSRTGARDAHLISRRARKHYTGMLIITQNPLKDLALMGDEFITQQLIIPFEKDHIARAVAASVGIPLDEYPDIEDFFLAKPATDQMRDPTAFDEDFDDDGTAGAPRPR